MKWIGFDTAQQRTGYAYQVGKQWVTGVFKPRDTARLVSIINSAIAQGITHAAVEDPYLGQNVKTLKALQEATVRVVVRCEDAGLDVERYSAQTWQSGFSLAGKRDKRKDGSKRVAIMLGAPEGISEDEADAVCLCEYARCHGRQLGLMLMGPRGGKMK